MRRLRTPAACIVTCFFAAAQLHSQTNSLIDTGHLTVNGRDVTYRIRNLPINAYPDLPEPIASALESRGCVIPQTYQAKRPENVIHGNFERSGSDDWAVLCSSKGVVSLLVFFSDGRVNDPEVVASANLTTRAQAHDSTGELGFNWGIDTATPKQVHEAQAGMAHRPSPPPYDCVADTTLGSNTHYRLFRHGEWGQVDTGVD